jgi:hypothetical protein
MVLYRSVSLLLILLLVTTGKLCAQLDDRAVMRIARRDAFRNFHLNKVDFNEFRKHRRDQSGAYFNPQLSTVSNPSFLNDSVYVESFRHFAYLKTRSRHTAGHYVLWGGAVMVVAAGMLVVILSTLDFDFFDTSQII